MTVDVILPPKFHWSIDPAPNADRYWVSCRCSHGSITGLAMVHSTGVEVDITPHVETVAENLRRQTHCQCDGLVPPLDPGNPQNVPAWRNPSDAS